MFSDKNQTQVFMLGYLINVYMFQINIWIRFFLEKIAISVLFGLNRLNPYSTSVPIHLVV